MPVSINNTEEIAGYAFAANEPYVGFYAAGVNSIAQIEHTGTLHLQSTLAEWSLATKWAGIAWHYGSYTASGMGTRLA